MLPVDRTDRARDALEQRCQRGIALLLAAMPAALAVEIPIGLVEDVVAPDPRFVGVARGEFTPQGDGTTLVFGAVPQRRRVGIAIGDRQVGPLPARRGGGLETDRQSGG